MSKQNPTMIRKAKYFVTFKHIRHLAFWTIAVVLVLTLIGWILLYKHHHDEVVQVQQQRLAKIHQIQDVFQSNIKHSLGTNITSMNETDSCYDLNQTDFSSGNLYCGSDLRGTVSTNSESEKNTALQISALAKTALRQSGTTVFDESTFTDHQFGSNGSVFIYYIYYLYGSSSNTNSVRCDVTVNTPFSIDNVNGPNYKVNSLDIRFDCEQPASKEFYPFQN